MRWPQLARALALGALSALVLSGCVNVSQLSFRVDHRLDFQAPESRQLVHLPVTFAWTMRDFTVARPGSGPVDDHTGYFAIFVDRAPVRPGQTLDAIAKADKLCLPSRGCPDANYLRQRQVYTSARTTFTLKEVKPLDTKDSEQLHDLTVVLMDTSGHRIGESAWHREFKVKPKVQL